MYFHTLFGQEITNVNTQRWLSDWGLDEECNSITLFGWRLDEQRRNKNDEETKYCITD